MSRKLVKQQTELYQISEILGAEFLWTYENSCTHFIYTGKLTDTNKELKIAKEQKKIIVSANWIHACKEQKQHVDEGPYLFSNTKAAARRSSVPKKAHTEEPLQIIETATVPKKKDTNEIENLPNKEINMKENVLREEPQLTEQPAHFETSHRENIEVI